MVLGYYTYFRVDRFLPPTAFSVAMGLVTFHAINRLLIIFKQKKVAEVQHENNEHVPNSDEEVPKKANYFICPL
jgi:hypothetical protein